MGLHPRALPDFPWDALAPYAARARSHEDGIVDLSVGTPVDPTPQVIREALTQAADAPGYPTTHGTPELREAICTWFAHRRNVAGLDADQVLPTIGSKELVALLPSLLGLGDGDIVVHPAVAYPTYDVGTRLAGATALATDSVEDWAGNPAVRLVWVNSPSNPTGAVLDVEALAPVVAAARDIGAIVASDECYAEFAWRPGDQGDVPSILDPRVSGGSTDRLLAVYSLSKQSNLAGYRAAFVAGDRGIIGSLLDVRKHMGMILPSPVQAAMVAALADDAHVAVQRTRYAARRDVLRPALEAGGFRIDASEAGLYLWATRDEDCWTSVERMASMGILVAPGAFYGSQGARHVRVALTATDGAITAAARRLVNDR